MKYIHIYLLSILHIYLCIYIYINIYIILLCYSLEKESVVMTNVVVFIV